MFCVAALEITTLAAAGTAQAPSVAKDRDMYRKDRIGTPPKGNSAQTLPSDC
ncbi:MAG TPA: hypothetical protein VKR31_02835 [Rhizomicrobium sp.]|nr:hypothetical protein [Rhizomicrobium sp.]